MYQSDTLPIVLPSPLTCLPSYWLNGTSPCYATANKCDRFHSSSLEFGSNAKSPWYLFGATRSCQIRGLGLRKIAVCWVFIFVLGLLIRTAPQLITLCYRSYATVRRQWTKSIPAQTSLSRREPDWHRSQHAAIIQLWFKVIVWVGSITQTVE